MEHNMGEERPARAPRCVVTGAPCTGTSNQRRMLPPGQNHSHQSAPHREEETTVFMLPEAPPKK